MAKVANYFGRGVVGLGMVFFFFVYSDLIHIPHYLLFLCFSVSHLFFSTK